MKTITLQILAEDIKTSVYTDSSSCAITKALKRSRLVAHESGGMIYIDDSFRGINTPTELSYKVLAMYAHLDKHWDKQAKSCKWTEEVLERGTLEPKDFTFDIEVPDNW